MVKILIAIPTYEHIYPECFKSIYDLDIPENVKVDFDFIKGYDCARSRNELCRKAKNYDFIFMVDSDIILPKKALCNLYSHFKAARKDEIVGMILGAYPRKHNPKKVEIFNFNGYYDHGQEDYKDDYRYTVKEIKDISDDFVMCKGGGLGCALIDCKIFSKLSFPWFKYFLYDDGGVLSEDLYFCYKLNANNIRIILDTTFVCGHIKSITL